MLNGLFAAEATEWNGWAILALIVTNAGTLYQLIKKERRNDNDQDGGREDTLVAQWRAWGKAMEKGRLEAEKKRLDAEDRERKLIGEVARLAEQVRHGQNQIEDLERDADQANPGRQK